MGNYIPIPMNVCLRRCDICLTAGLTCQTIMASPKSFASFGHRQVPRGSYGHLYRLPLAMSNGNPPCICLTIELMIVFPINC